MSFVWLLCVSQGWVNFYNDLVAVKEDALTQKGWHDILGSWQLQVKLVDLKDDPLHLNEFIKSKRTAHQSAYVLDDRILDFRVFRSEKQRDTCDESADLLTYNVVAAFVGGSQPVNHVLHLQ